MPQKSKNKRLDVWTIRFVKSGAKEYKSQLWAHCTRTQAGNSSQKIPNKPFNVFMNQWNLGFKTKTLTPLTFKKFGTTKTLRKNVAENFNQISNPSNICKAVDDWFTATLGNNITEPRLKFLHHARYPKQFFAAIDYICRLLLHGKDLYTSGPLPGVKMPNWRI